MGWRARVGERTLAAFALLVLALLALHPLLDSRLLLGHDARTYPLRLTEWLRAVGDGHWPPVWAPDLDSGHGEPLFEFAPPLLYAAATPFRLAGLELAASLQLALAF